MDAQQVTPAGAVSDHSDASDDGEIAVKHQRRTAVSKKECRDTDESDSDMPAKTTYKETPKIHSQVTG